MGLFVIVWLGLVVVGWRVLAYLQGEEGVEAFDVCLMALCFLPVAAAMAVVILAPLAP